MIDAPMSSAVPPQLDLRADRALIRAAAKSRRYLLAEIQAPRAPARESRTPVSVALVLDRSGSMADDSKFGLARQAVERALGMLRDSDAFSLVVFDDGIDVLAPMGRATPQAKARALEALRAVHPRGSTDLCGGWLRGCEQVAERLQDDGIARVLLLTDGLANAGTTTPSIILRHASELRRRGIATSTFGVGADFDERLLRDMAHEGGGNFYFVSEAAQIPDFLASELGEALEVVMRRAVLHVVVPRGCRVEPLNRFRHHEDGRAVHIELGDLVSGQQVSVVVALRFPAGSEGGQRAVEVTLDADDARVPRAEADVAWTYAGHRENDAQPRDRIVDREVATLYAARARAEAAEANRTGRLKAARRVIEATVKRIRSYAGEDAVLHRIADALEAEVHDFAVAEMSPMSLKMAVFEAEIVGRSRGAMGEARR